MQFSLRTLMLAMTVLCFLIWWCRVPQSILSGRVIGRVDVEGVAVENAYVRFFPCVYDRGYSGSEISVVTDVNGDFSAPLPAGYHAVHVSLPKEFTPSQPHAYWDYGQPTIFVRGNETKKLTVRVREVSSRTLHN